jgi:hypothetical protein
VVRLDAGGCGIPDAAMTEGQAGCSSGWCFAVGDPNLEGPALDGVWGAAPSDVWVVGSGGTIRHWNGVSWSDAASGVTEDLTDVWGSRTDDVWAVGAAGTILHWDGVSWTSVDHGSTNDLRGVWGSGADDVWAVGAGSTILHWNGANWSPTPNGANGDFADVSGTGPNDAWVVGQGGALSHWDGSTWSDRSADTVGSNGWPWTATWAAARDDAWVVTNDVPRDPYHWNGSRWLPVGAEVSVDENSSLYPSALGIWGASASDVWVVGANGVIVHWDGTSMVGMPSGSAMTLRGVWGASSADVWAVGDGATILHWDGLSWSKATGFTRASITTDSLTAVWSNGPDDAWAVGSGGTTLHWNGSAWSMEKKLRFAPSGVWGGGPNDVWVVGLNNVGAGNVAHRTGAGWSVTTLHSASTGNPISSLSAVWGSGADNVWALGVGGTVHWNGAEWSEVEGGGGTSLWGTGPNDVWSAFRTTLRHWDGANWAQLPPIQADGVGFPPNITGVWTGRPNDVWAVRGGSILHGTGTPTTFASMDCLDRPRTELSTVWGTKPDDVWFVARVSSPGHYQAKTAIVHWDGSSFDASFVNASIAAIGGSGPNDIWAVGGGAILHHR